MPDYNRYNGYGEDKDEGKKSIVQVKTDLPEHFEPRCHVCTSKYRHAIERLLALGTSYSQISKSFGSEIDRRSISNHAREHLSYEQAAIREIIDHEARQVQANYEEGVKGALMHRTYLSTALQRAWEDLVDGRARIDPAVAIQIIQQLDKLDRESHSAAVEELRFQFNAFMEAVKRIVPRDMWENIAEETQKVIARSQGDIEGTALPAGG